MYENAHLNLRIFLQKMYDYYISIYFILYYNYMHSNRNILNINIYCSKK